jgi:hypothetical protein
MQEYIKQYLIESIQLIEEQGKQIEKDLRDNLDMNHFPHSQFVEGVKFGRTQTEKFARMVIEKIITEFIVEVKEE